MSYTTVDGRRVRESTKTTDYDIAKRMLDDKRGRIARGETVLPRLDKITYDEARDDLRAFYETHKTRDLAEADVRLKRLDAFFRGYRLANITPDIITKYVRDRQAPKMLDEGEAEPGAANGTINRELATLSKMLRLAYEHSKLQRLPVIKRLREAAPRAGFVTRGQFIDVREHLPEELQVAMTVAYTFGWRKREVLDLERRQYDIQAGVLRLDPGATKNGEGRVVHLTSELRAMLGTQTAHLDRIERERGREVRWLFPHLDGPLAGERIAEPRKAWLRACKAAGLPGLLIHDLRRSAVRNMEAAGVPRSVAMKLTGHKTEAVYRRYAIVSDAELREAAEKLAGGGAAEASVTFLSRSGRPSQETRSATT